MVKSKFPGKPSKIVQRSLVRAFSVAVPTCDSTVVSEEVLLGLSVFDQTFGAKDEVSSFKGFSTAEIDKSFTKKEAFVSQVRDKFAQRGVAFTLLPSCGKRLAVASTASNADFVVPKPSNESCEADIEFPPISCRRERRKCGKMWLINKKVTRYHSKIPVRHNFKTLSKNNLMRFKHKSSNYLSDKYCRKFVLPSRSAHSSRVIKPNKRFIESDKSAKSRLLLKNFKTHKYDANSRSLVISTASKPDYNGSGVVPSSKVIIREARLNISTETAIAGPFSAKKTISFTRDKVKSGVITCGICGAVRCYKYILQTKKFGIYSCEPCRRFILRMIKLSKQSSCEILKCKAENGFGKCVISPGVLCKLSPGEEISSKSSRCHACWLMLCLQKYIMPNALRKMLIKLMPEGLKTFSSYVVSMDLTKKSLFYESAIDNKCELEENNDTLKKRLRKNHFYKGSLPNRRSIEKNEIVSTKSRPVLHKKNVPSHKTNSKNKWISDGPSKENHEKELHVPRGPRIKHVCRSASSVLRSSLVTSNDTEEEEENQCVSSEPDRNNIENNGFDGEKNQKHGANDGSSLCDEISENNEFASQKYGPRSLQDFCRESLVEAEEKEDKLISIDFWEAYDPDEIYKTGFSLIGSEPTNVRALCFLCGSAGQEKLLYCVSCCEAYHWFCAEGPSAFREEAELEKCRVNWVCRKCKVCSACGERSARALISCQRCRCSYHPECLTNKALNKRLFSSDRPWVCPSCLKCKSCNVSSVFTFVGNVPLCSQCFKLRQKGNYCPLCQGCYQDEDYNVQMMECGICKCWIHARCEGVSDEKYQILSFLPETIEYVCKLCCETPPAQWWLAVEDELKTGYLGILKNLCKNKLFNELFKESPRKNNVLCRCEPRPVPLSKVPSQPLNCLQSAVCVDNPPSAAKRCLNFNHESSPLSNGGDGDLIHSDTSTSTICTAPVRESDNSNFNKLAMDDTDLLPTRLSSSPSECEANATDSCSICSAANETRTRISRGLLTVKNNVHSNRYASLSAFHDDLENALASIDEGRLVSTYRDTLKKFFPWFDVKEATRQSRPGDSSGDFLSEAHQSTDLVTTSFDSVTSISVSAASGIDYEEFGDVGAEEHCYEQLRRLMAEDEYPYESVRQLDVRTCILCKGMGEAASTDGGRLVYCGRNEWVHSNCALWSSEVFEEIDGSLQNVHRAISRGRQIRCTMCDKKGASVGCCYKNCGSTYHFVCARKARCKFFHNKTIYCGVHDTLATTSSAPLRLEGNEEANVAALSVSVLSPASEKDFEILRPVYVEMERKKKRFECHTNVKLRIGSLLVDSLGKFDPHLSDDPKRIIPMYFRCTRLFWSTVRPWKIVQYYIQIKVRYTYESVPAAECEANYTVDHSPPDEIVLQVVEEVVNKVCALDERRLCDVSSVNGQADLLFPELQDAIYKDLPNDVLNDRTLHDIWKDYDNGDDVSVCNEKECNVEDATDINDEYVNTVPSEEKNILGAFSNVSDCTEKGDLKSVRLKTGTFANSKCLRDKNHVIRDVSKQNCATNSLNHCSWPKQVRGGRLKRRTNFENSSSTTKRKKYENYVSPAKLDDALEYYASYKNILQLDGMVDIYNDEEPVKCIQCHRTYRTTLSFERHLETCNSDFSDYMISSCESDSASSEEDKTFCTTSIDMINGNGMIMAGAPTHMGFATATPTAPLNEITADMFTTKYAPTVGSAATYIVNNGEKMIPAQPLNGAAANLCTNVTYNGVYPTYTAATYEDAQLMDNGTCNNAGTNIVGNNTIALQTLLHGAIKQEPLTAVVSSPSIAVHTVEPPPSMKLNFVSSGNGLVAGKACTTGYATPSHFTFTGGNLPAPQYEVQNVTATAAPTYLIQQSYPKAELIPTYVAVNNSVINEAAATATTYLSPPAPTTATLQLQQIPATSVNFQPLMPTILGTIVQPNVVETPTYIVNAAAAPAAATTHTFAASAAGAHSNIILPGQPVIFGLETVVSNTIMSSSQFLTQSQTGNVGASTMYSTTTTQVFQAAKPVQQQPEFASSYIVLNPSTSTQSSPVPVSAPNILHTSLPQHTSIGVSTSVPATKQLQPVVASRALSNNSETYMYVHLNQVPISAASVSNASPSMLAVERRKAPIIMKPAKQTADVQPRKSIKIMKVKNNRPVGIELKDANVTCDVKPTLIANEKLRKLQIKTTDKAIKLGKACPRVQPGIAYRLVEPVTSLKGVVTQSLSSCEDEIKPFTRHNNNNNNICPVISTPAQPETYVFVSKSVSSSADIKSSSLSPLPPAAVPTLCSAMGSTIDPISLVVKEKKLCPVTSPESGGSVLEILPVANGPVEDTSTFETHVESQPLVLPSAQVSATKSPEPESEPLKLTSSLTSNGSVASSSTSTSASNVARQSDVEPPVAVKPPVVSQRQAAVTAAQSETERLFDELMRQHLEHEKRRKQQRAAETAVAHQQPAAAAASAAIAVIAPNTANSPPAASPKIQIPASMPVLDENTALQCQPGCQVPVSQTAEEIPTELLPAPPLPSTASTATPSPPALKNLPISLNAVKNKFKPNLPPRTVAVPEEINTTTANITSVKGKTAAGVMTMATASATAVSSRKLKKSPEKENKKVRGIGGQNEATVVAASAVTAVAAQKSWKTASISFEVNAEDGFSYKTNNLLDLWNKILESVQQSRAKYKLPLLPKNASMDAESVYGLLGFENNASKYLLEQLPDAWKCIFYKPVFHKAQLRSGKTPLAENKTGCARSEPFMCSHKYDMFSWLASMHRERPKFLRFSDSDIVNGNRRKTNPNQPLARRFQNLKKTSKETVGVFRSDIHGRGLFCLRDIDAEEMVIEYAGEVIRSTLTDKRERYYTSEGMGCYMFRIDDRYVVDATMCGNAARFINHSCEPNCYSRIVEVLGKKHIIIFALRRIKPGEELTYDYKFPLEDEKIDCHCLSKRCRKYLN